MIKYVLSLILSVSFAAYAIAGSGTTQGEYKGPARGTELNKNNTLCSTGKNQSPIHIKGVFKTTLPPIKFNYSSPSNSIANTGNHIQVFFYEKSTNITVGNHQFSLTQIHFHTQSEHRISGKSYALEAHFVHSDENGNSAIIAVFFKHGKKNNKLQKILNGAPKKANRIRFFKNLDAIDLLPINKEYYRYNGSFTTPPCAEGVSWLLFKEPMELSKSQIKEFRKQLKHSNNRPIQPLNARIISK